MPFTISEEQISSTELRGYESFWIVAKDRPGDGKMVLSLKVLGQMYGLRAEPKAVERQLSVRVADIDDLETEDRVRTALTEKLRSKKSA